MFSNIILVVLKNYASTEGVQQKIKHFLRVKNNNKVEFRESSGRQNY